MGNMGSMGPMDNSNKNLPGTFISNSYVSSVNYDNNGQPHKETYQSQSIRQTDNEGKRIQEKQQAYQNTRTGVQKAAHERMLNEKGHKIVKARDRNTGEDYEHNIFKGGLNENEIDGFNNDYNQYRNKVNFENNYRVIEGSRRNLPQGSQGYHANRNGNGNSMALGGSGYGGSNNFKGALPGSYNKNYRK